MKETPMNPRHWLIMFAPFGTSWAESRREYLNPERAIQAPRPLMARPFRTQWRRNPKPKAWPWAGMGQAVGLQNISRTNR